MFPSLRSTFVIHGVERFLAWLYSRFLVEHGAQRPDGTRSAAI
jgi:hypothetical protein